MMLSKRGPSVDTLMLFFQSWRSPLSRHEQYLCWLVCVKRDLQTFVWIIRSLRCLQVIHIQDKLILIDIQAMNTMLRLV